MSIMSPLEMELQLKSSETGIATENMKDLPDGGYHN